MKYKLSTEDCGANNAFEGTSLCHLFNTPNQGHSYRGAWGHVPPPPPPMPPQKKKSCIYIFYFANIARVQILCTPTKSCLRILKICFKICLFDCF